MFDQLSGRLEKMVKFLRGEVKVTDRNMAEALKMMRLAFLEADVNYKVVKDFEARIKDKAMGEEVLSGLNPAQQVIKIVRDELTGILGGAQKPLQFANRPPSVFMLVGLQGSGKTTTCGKLARYVRGLGRNPLLVSFDLKRPAAQDQLRTIAAGLGISFHEMSPARMASPRESLKELLAFAAGRGFDPLIVDTAGRLHIDNELMEELRLVKDILAPVETLYVGDAMTGQDAVRSAQAFEERIGLTGVILTKLDGDARGGAALSIVSATGRPIKFIGVGEKPDQLEVFHPERMASRILGMGDMMTLIEKAQEQAGLAEAEDLARKLRKQEFTLEDFKKQIAQMRKMGSLADLLGHLPQVGPFKGLGKAPIDESKMTHFTAIIDSMTPAERREPKILNGSRRARIARGSGRPVHEINQLVKQFLEMQKMMKRASVQKLLGKLQ
jgi:signal recognition particle subunit SRP54